LLIPYRVKNPIKRFPFATLLLVTINVGIFIAATDHLVVINRQILDKYDFAFGVSPWVNFLTASFLHAHVFHLVWNMIFLWVFGRPVEDRLGHLVYLILYFGAGLIGNILQAYVDVSFAGAVKPCIGASGCIMGVVGAYWYLYSWSTVCVGYWIWFIRGTWEIPAFWVVGTYVLLDILQGSISNIRGSQGGVANFCHVGGSIAGALFCLLIRAKRDAVDLSKAKAIQADSRDLRNMPFHALEVMLKADPENLELIRAAMEPAIRNRKQHVINGILARLGPSLIDEDPALVAWYLVDLHGSSKIYEAVHLLRLARHMERVGDPVQAMSVYRLITEGWVGEPEAEIALFRMASYSWNVMKDSETALTLLEEMKCRYPSGEMDRFAEGLMHRIGNM